MCWEYTERVMRIEFDSENFATLTVDANGDLTVAPTGTLILGDSASVLPDVYKPTALFENPTPGNISGGYATTTAVPLVDMGVNYPNSNCTGLCWTGRRYIGVESAGDSIIRFLDNSLVAVANKYGRVSMTTGIASLLGAAWDGRYVWATAAGNLYGFDIDVDNAAATLIATLDVGTSSGCVTYARGSLFMLDDTGASATMSCVRWDGGDTFTTHYTGNGSFGADTASFMAYDGQYLYVADNDGTDIQVCTLDAVNVATYTSSVTEVAGCWNGQNLVIIDNSDNLQACELPIRNSYATVMRNYGRIGALSTTEQLRLEYDADSYASFTVSSTGGLTVGGADTDAGELTCVRVVETSDERLKTDVVPVSPDSAVEKIEKLQLKEFTVNGSRRRCGLIAQELEEVMPIAVRSQSGKLPDGTEVDDLRSVDYHSVLGYAIAAMQRVRAENEALQTRLARLEEATARLN